MKIYDLYKQSKLIEEISIAKEIKRKEETKNNGNKDECKYTNKLKID